MVHYYPYSFSSSDFPKYVLAVNETITDKNYGAWAQGTFIAQKPYRHPDTDPFSSHDFLHIEFKRSIKMSQLLVDPRWKKVIYRMWGFRRNKEKPNRSPVWKLLYVAPQSKEFATRPIKYFGSVTEIRFEFNRNFGIQCYELINFMNGELVFSIPPLDYDIPKNNWMKDEVPKLMSNMDPQEKPNTKSKGKNFFETLPTEAMYKIFNYLDLVSLSRCAQVNKRWNRIASDPLFYRDIDLKMYWTKLNSTTLKLLMKKFNRLRKLDMTVCNNPINYFGLFSEHFDIVLKRILQKSRKTLTHLCLNHTRFVNSEILDMIVACPNLQELRLQRPSVCSWTVDLSNLAMTKLKTLDVSRARITEEELIPILKNNPNLEYLSIDGCSQLGGPGRILETIVTYNRNLKAWSSWQTFQNQDNAQIYEDFGELLHLEELDLGFCEPRPYTNTCLEIIVLRCEKLKRLGLTNWNLMTDEQLLPILKEAKGLTQLNLAHMPKISASVLSQAVTSIPNLCLLDIRHCVGINKKIVEEYKKQYPNINIFHQKYLHV
ncbi:hypothetical protein ABEB36_004341 [Hypothenemus hampei]|uniref:F-box domain-containing protein n=1 Tax=Hypothenemus hampei TaxID=57062 RepID=A0ABD1F3M0_HYPHA